MWRLLLILMQILQFTLSRRLNYNPGTRYSYSNLGYAILGEIIATKEWDALPGLCGNESAEAS